MRIPRDIDGTFLVKALRAFGYEVTRQTGSHIRLTTTVNGEHHVTVPAHAPIKIGTFSGILTDVANHHAISREKLLAKLGF